MNASLCYYVLILLICCILVNAELWHGLVQQGVGVGAQEVVYQATCVQSTITEYATVPLSYGPIIPVAQELTIT